MFLISTLLPTLSAINVTTRGLFKYISSIGTASRLAQANVANSEMVNSSKKTPF